MRIRLLIILFLLFTALALPLTGQNYTMNGSPITDCNGTFFDPGGQTGNYSDDQTLSTTICSDGANGTHIRLSFSGADLAPGDALCFYDGQNLAAPLLSCQTDYNPGQPFVLQATAVNPSGCLTVSFVSNGSGNASGWAAAISCVPSCQSILADLVSTTPASLPPDTGWIDICPGDRVFFNGVGIYPQNNFAYPQSDLTTSFEWNFGDGGISYGPNTSHRFDNPGGYFVQLALTDDQGCRNTNLVNQRIRVAPKPDFQLLGMLDQSICAGDTVSLSANTSGSGGQTLIVTPSNASFAVEGSRSDSLALPDGTGIPYETTIFFTEFSPGQVLVTPTDLESICVNIEHSWARDVEISLTCPNGQSIILHDHPGNTGNQVYLGQPNDMDNVIPIPGLGYDYCWINNAPNPTWIDYANNLPNGSGTIPSGDYSTFDPISNLVGCPLNGEWTISVTDWWPIDNGFIFNWSLKFLDQLYPNIETFTPAIVSWGWNNHPSIFFSTVDSIAAAPQNAGTAGYTFTVNDSYGCAWDTLLTLTVLPPTHPNCFSCGADVPVLRDTTICTGESVLLNASPIAPPAQVVRFESYPEYQLGNANHPHNNPYYAPVDVSSLGYPIITNPIQQIASVCLDIETDYCSDLNIFLQAPSGQLLELSSGNGGAGDNYKITCFTPAAVTPIIGQAAPFNGTYRPEGNWNSLLGSAVNGDWSLRVSDGFAPNQFGKVKWWSIGFNVNNSVNYSWVNAGSLSCSTCPNPTATPVQSSTYTVNTTDAFGCQHHDTVQVNITAFFPAPTGLAVFNIGAGTMTWVWDAVPGALGYEVRVDGGAWQPANNGLMHNVNGLSIGQNVSIEVRAISPGCTPLVAQASSPYGNCTLVASLNVVSPLLCAGDSTGSALVSIVGGNMPIQFIVDNWPGTFLNGNLQNIFPAGNHSIIARDVTGCADTVNFNIASPPSINLNLSVVNVNCNGLNTGAASTNAMGGAGAFNFAWQACLGGPQQAGSSISGLAAGCYALTATDGNGCSATQSVTITEPAVVSYVGSQMPVACFGGNSGAATVTVSGGVMPYNYLWDNSQTTATAMGFTAGFHFVTITDANLCQATTVVEVTQPQELMVSSTNTQPVSCFGGSNGSASVIMVGGTTPYSYSWDNGQTTQTAQNIPSGPHGVTVTDANGCMTQIVVTVSEPFELISSFTSVVNEPCAGNCQGQAMIQPAGGTLPYSYSWNNPNITPGVQTATGLCSGAYTVTVQDANGCTNVEMVNIAAGIPIQVQFSPTLPTCSGISNGAIGSTATGGAMPYQYFWENGSNTPTLQNVACGNHFLTLTDALGCQHFDTIMLNCPPAVTINSIDIQPVKCFGDATGTANANAQGGNPPYTFQWSDVNAQTTQQALNLLTGTYTVTATDANNCIATATATVPQPGPLSSTINLVNVSCFNAATGIATANPGGGTAPYTFNWSSASNTAQSTGLSAGTYTVTITDANLCTTTNSATITQPIQGVQVTLVQTRAACFGETNGEAIATASGGAGGPFTFLWSNGQQTAMASGLTAGTYTVTVTDQATCTGTQSIIVQELGKIMVNVAFVPPSCYGIADAQAAVNLITGGAGMGDTSLYQFRWSVPGAQDAAQISGLAGDSTYFITVTDLQGCSGTFSFLVNQPPEITLNSDIEDVKCFGGNDGSATITGVLNANQPVVYDWSNANASPQIMALVAGVYTVTVTDTEGCKATKIFEINEPEVLGLSFQQQPLLCATDSNATIAVVVTGGTGDYTYQWINGENTATINQLGPGQYSLTVTDRNGCTVTGVQTIEQPDSLLLASQLTEPECFGEQNGRIKLLVTGGRAPYRYSLMDDVFGGSSNFIALGAGVYSMQVRDAYGCITSLVDTLGQPPAVAVMLASDTTIILGDSLLLSATTSNTFGATNYQWSSTLVDSFTCVDAVFCDEILITPFISNTYRLTVTDENGCAGKASIHVRVEKPRGVYVPTAFSPNDDQNNDLLLVHGLSRQVRNILTFKVYDRWGELVYEDQNFTVNQVSRGWDGQFRNQPSDPGVYIWVLEAEYIDGHRELLKGDVTLIR